MQFFLARFFSSLGFCPFHTDFISLAETQTIAAALSDAAMELQETAQAALSAVGQEKYLFFTLQEMNTEIQTALVDFALDVQIAEYGSQKLRVTFPGVIGEPPEYLLIQETILDILPCHLEIEYYLRYLTWAECEAAKMAWASIEAAAHTWESFEKSVPNG